MPGPDVEVIARAPAQPAPITIPIDAISSSACTIGVRRLAGRLVLPVLLHVADQRLGQRRGRRDRIPGADGDAGHHAAEAPPRHCPSTRIMPGGLVHPLDPDTDPPSADAASAYAEPASSAAMLSSIAFSFLPICRFSACSICADIDVQQLRQHPVVDHVLDEPAQLRVLADLGDDLVEGHRIEHQVAAQRVQLQRLVVERPRRPASSVSTSSLAVSGFIATRKSTSFLRRDVAVLVGADGVPGRQARRCSTGTCSCPTPGRPSGRLPAAGRDWRSGCPSR